MRRFAGLTLALLTVCISIQADAATHPRLPLSDSRWLAPGPERIQSLTMAPPECYRPPADVERRRAAEAGRIAFRTPLLLGGPAAKSGLSCQSCHVNGHDNPAFHLDRLSGAPGTVDVTSNLFSKTRGDGIFNPIPIPSLVDRVRLRQQQGAEGEAALTRFVHGVIVDEFQGTPPAPVVFDALLTYVASLDPGACSSQVSSPIRLSDDWQTILRGADVLQSSLERGDAALADFLVIGLRSLLGRIDERFEVRGLKLPRTRLLDLSHQLAQVRDLIVASPEKTKAAVSVWQIELQQSGDLLMRHESQSLYNPAKLAELLGAESTQTRESQDSKK